jgi:hypothetical protein
MKLSGADGLQVYDRNGDLHTKVDPLTGLKGIIINSAGEEEMLYGAKTDDLSSEQVFFMKRAEVAQHITIGDMQILHMTANEGANAGIAFVPRG